MNMKYNKNYDNGKLTWLTHQLNIIDLMYNLITTNHKYSSNLPVPNLVLKS